MITSKLIHVPPLLYATTGQYGVIFSDASISWYSCRESFHLRNSGKPFYFCHTNINLLSEFVDHVEDKLGVKKSLFNKTTNSRVIQVCPSKFWRKSMRFSLFSIILRASLSYDGVDPMEVLYKQRYIETSKLAMRRFLDGFVYYRGENSYGALGWHHLFSATSMLPCLGANECNCPDKRCQKFVEKRLTHSRLHQFMELFKWTEEKH